MPWIFGSFLVSPCAWHAVTFWLVNRTTRSRHSGCVTGRRSRDENRAVRFRQSAENSRVRDTQPTRAVSDELARGCNYSHPQAPGRRYRKKKTSLWVYMSLHPYLTHHRNINPFENKVWEMYIFIKKFVNYIWLCFHLYMYVAIQNIMILNKEIEAEIYLINI